MVSDRSVTAPQEPTGPGTTSESAAPGSGGAELAVRVASRLGSPAGTAAGVVLVEEIERAMPVRAWLACADPETGAFAWADAARAEPFPLRLCAEEGGLVGAALRSGRPGAVPDPAGCPAGPERRYLQRSGGAWLFLPLTVSGRPRGCLILRGATPGDLPARCAEALGPSLVLTALALEVARLHRELDHRVEERTGEISLLYDVSRSLGFVLSLDDLDHLVAASLGRALPIDLCALTLLAPEHRRISVHLSHPAPERAVHRLRREVISELARLCGTRPRRLRLSISGPEAAAGPPSGGGEPLSIAHAPIVIRGQVAGLISVASRGREPFGPAPLRLVYTIASQASLTLDRIRTAREAEASRVHSMLESMADGVLLLDRGLGIVMTNPAAQSYLEALGAPPTGALARIGEVPLAPLMEDLGKEEARPRSFEVTDPHQGKVFSITCSAVRGLDESIQGMVVVLSDVTEARMLQLQFAQNEKLSALGEMISGVAHELNNPLAAVMGYAQLLQDEPIGEPIRRKLAAIDAEATRCRRIVQNLLRFARRHTPERRPVDLHAAIDSVLQLLGHQLEVEDIVVSLDLDPRLRPVIGDVHLLQQVFLNIIFNAYQAMKEKGGPGRLVIATRGDEDRAVVEITDDGPGIAPQNLKRIFDPFFSTKQVGQGTGLGLSLVYSTVREHGGTITAKSTVGAGSTFTVDLPAAPPGTVVEEGAPEVASRGLAAGSQAPGAAPRAGTASGRRILVVEDESALAEVIAEVLQAHGHLVDTAGDGRSARAKLGSVRYDMIISDLKMPNMDGRDLYRHVASIDPSLARRIVFSSGDTASPDTQAFFEEVGNPFLAKPFNIKELIRVVDSVLGAA